MDENWLSIPFCSGDVEHEGKQIAEEIRRRVREETGLTVSIGVSFSKIFAKLGSDMKKPDAVTTISKDNYRDRFGLLQYLNYCTLGALQHASWWV